MPRRAKPLKIKDADENKIFECSKISKSQKKLEKFQNKVDNFLNGLRELENGMTKEQYLEKIRLVFNKSKTPEILVQKYLLEKLCEECQHFKDDHLILLCDYCDDAYHTYCLKPKLTQLPPEDQEWMCYKCVSQLRDQARTVKKTRSKQNTMDNYVNSENKKQRCNKCQQEAESTENCIHCKGAYHSTCFNDSKHSIVCTKCDLEIKKKIPQSQTTMRDYFKVQKGSKQSEKKQIFSDTTSYASETTQISRIKLKKNKGDLFKLPTSTEDIQLKQQKSLVYALQAKNIEFSDELRYSKECPESSNNCKLESVLESISPHNKEIFLEFKKITAQGIYAPVIIEEDKTQGFIVKAIATILKQTLICEYVGDVDFARNRIFDKNDSIMDLLRTPRSSTSLVICPEKFGNLGRFISGINNKDKNSKQKQNVQSLRFSVDGKARVILFAKKKINKGDVLYYDYNAGGFDEYPTEQFV